jgi:glycosyltransferase involved in cell wall biosynthesis
MQTVGSETTSPRAATAMGSTNARRPVKLALVASLPSHVHAPLYRRLAQDPRVDFTALFASTAGVQPADYGFGKPVVFEPDVLAGYRSTFLRGAAAEVNLRSPWALRDPNVVSQLIKGQYEVLYLQGYNYLVYLLAVASMRLRRLPVLFREEQTLIHPRPMGKTIVKEIALRILFRRSFGLYLGTESRRWFEHYGIPPERLFWVPYSVEEQRLRAAARQLAPRREQLLQSFGLPQGQPVFLMVGRLVPKKQPLAVLEAFRRARREVSCSLLVVGTGELEREMRDRISADGIPDVALAGFLSQPELPRAYASADAFVLFSMINETWGLVVNEAMTFGLPVLVSDKVGSATDLVQPGRNGFKVAPEDIEALSRQMTTLARDPDLRARMGRESLRMIQEWTPEVAANGVLDAVAAAVGAKRWRETLQPDPGPS